MRTIYHIFLIILLFDVSISGQSLNGTGTDATGGKAEVGQEYNYRFDDPFLIQDSIGYLKWNVNNGKIISDGNGSSDAKIKWTGTIETSGVSDGLYLLKIITGEAIESHKIMLK